MDREKLQFTLEKHSAWLNDEKNGKRADLRGANLERANLWRADLERANLWRADLEGADLRGADLRGADLEGADLEGANLRGADLRGADLDFSAWGLSCKTYGAIIDGRLVTQLLSHVLGCVSNSTEMKNLRKLKSVRNLAAQFNHCPDWVKDGKDNPNG